jgi:hypothetical protein
MDPNKCKSTDWPILGLIWQNCCSFYEKFVSVDNNWEKCPIMFNPLLRTGRGRGNDWAGVLQAQYTTHPLGTCKGDNGKRGL